ncbi:MFS transporter [Paenibacillus sp. LMG 31456]|uniref:MFS transporter n=1 Tax=Paenibacillus foliorum TaxID=2654974 RepID=A0A972GYS0_9BACL|nr:MFS transporter [Paenibacillus foliorum]NOU95355.1 MFS transporter [Paenibacillus foliorum]
MNISQSHLSRNIPLFYLYQFLNSFILDRGIWMLYLASRGFTLTEIGFIEALYHAVIFIFEVPTGYIADRFGNRTSLLLSQILGLLASGCLVLASNPIYIVAGFLLGAFVGTLQSGATSALVYETLKVQGKQEAFKKLTSRLSAIVLISMGLSGSAGGFLSDLHWEWVYIGKMVLHILSFLIILMIIEPLHVRGEEGSRETLLSGVTQLSFVNQLRKGYTFISESRPFLTLSLFGALLYSMSWSISFYSQILFQQNGLTNSTIGTVNGLETWVSAAITAVAYIGERWLGKKGSLILSASGFACCLVLFSASEGSVMVISCFFLLSVFISYLEPLLEAYLNELVPSSMRATMLSVFNMMVSAGMMITFLLLGILGDRMGVFTALQSVLVVWVPLLALSMLGCLRYTHSKNANPSNIK